MSPERYYYIATGHAESLRRLAENFAETGLRVFDFEGKHLLDADILQLGFEDYPSAENLLKSMEGAMRAAGMSLVDRCTISGSLFIEAESGTVRRSVLLPFNFNVLTIVVPPVTILIDGVPQGRPRSLASRIVDWLPLAGDEANALHLMMVKGEPDWRDIYVIAEILIGLGYPSEKNILGKVKDIKWTAGDWKAIGPEARHYKQKGDSPMNPPKLSEARATMLDLITSWFEEKAPP